MKIFQYQTRLKILSASWAAHWTTSLTDWQLYEKRTTVAKITFMKLLKLSAAQGERSKTFWHTEEITETKLAYEAVWNFKQELKHLNPWSENAVRERANLNAKVMTNFLRSGRFGYKHFHQASQSIILLILEVIIEFCLDRRYGANIKWFVESYLSRD